MTTSTLSAPSTINPPTSRHAPALSLTALAIPATLYWDFAWESTIGVDLPLAPPHAALYGAVALAALLALDLVRRGRAPTGAWLILWGVAAFLTAFLFDRWWQSLYGLTAGIWHPPQMLKALALAAICGGSWLCARTQPLPGALAAGSLLALASAAILPNLLANRQHGAVFFQLACLLFPAVLALSAVGSPFRYGALRAALAAFALGLLAVWLLPLVPGSPQVAPVYQPRDHLLPPPFPLLLFLPALAIDWQLRAPAGAGRRALEGGLAFLGLLLIVQWNFAPFLLSPAAEGWFFAGGGQHWPFFLKLDAASRTGFWRLAGDEMTPTAGVGCAMLAIASTRFGLWLGAIVKGARS